MGLTEITQGKKFRLFMSRLYGWGASVVILGALFKIQHYEGAGFMLVVGLSVEAIIFFFSAFEPPHEDVDWSLVYPELAGMHDEDPMERKKKKQVKDPVAQYLDKLLSDANIGPDLISSLGTGLKSLGENTSKMADLSNASVATNEYVKNVNQAAQSAGQLSQSYTRAAQAADQMSNASEDIKVYKDQVSSAGKNLAALNQYTNCNCRIRTSILSKLVSFMMVLMN